MGDRSRRGYTRRLVLQAPIERAFEAVGTIEGIRGWWTVLADGSAARAGEIRLDFDGLDEHFVMRVEKSDRPSLVEWRCVRSTGHREWEGTTIRFAFSEPEPGATELRFEHVGLVPELDCFDVCDRGWDSYLVLSLAPYVERGVGTPFAHETINLRAAAVAG